MHRKKWSKKTKQFLSITMASIMLMPSISHAREINKELLYDIPKSQNYQINDTQIKKGVDTKTSKDISVIVEFKSSPSIYQSKVQNKSTKTANSSVENDHQAFNAYLNNLSDSKYKSSSNIKHSYKNTFNGVSLTIKGEDVEKLLDCSVVKNIWPTEEVSLELPKDNTKKSSEDINTYMTNSNSHLGIEKLHKKGIDGEGIKIGVIDTGIDYNHPDLKDNYKGGYDFVNNDDDPMETTPKEWQESGQPEYHPQSGSSYYTSHGTHVSGTVAGTGKNTESEFATTGVAKNADLYAYKVLGAYGTGYTDDILAAVEKSVNDGMDIINLSLGANTNDPKYPTSVACDNAMLAGVTTVVANGNSGPNPGTVGSPAASPLAISVGASSVDMNIQNMDLSLGTIKKSSPLIGRDFDTNLESLNGEHELVYCGYGFSDDFTNVDVEGKIALVERGELSFNEKIMSAKENKAKAIIIYNNVDGEIDINLGESNEFIPTIGVDKSTGLKLKEEVDKNNNKVTINLGKVSTKKGDELADFSSRGPVVNGNIKPDVVAPGVSIMSTYPEFINHMEEGEDYKNAYARINGTSMASPHVAGVAALIKQENKDYDPFDIKLALMNNSEDLRHEYGIHEIGSGQINPKESINNNVFIKSIQTDESNNLAGEEITLTHENGALAFNNVVKGNEDIVIKKELIIENNSNKKKEFETDVEFLDANKDKNIQDAQKNKVKIKIKEEVNAKKKSETIVNVELKIPKEAQKGMYQGNIVFEDEDNDDKEYKVPFSVNYTDPGIKSVTTDRYSASNDLDWSHPFMVPGLRGTIELNEQVSRIDVLVKDYDTNEYVGYLGWLDGTYLTPNQVIDIPLFMASMAVYPLDKNNELGPDYENLTDGKYNLEFITKGSDKKTYSKETPFIIDNTPATYETDKKNGVHEISEKDFTTETDFNGVEHSAYWVHGKADDNSIKIFNEMNLGVGKDSIQIRSAVDGDPRKGPTFKVGKDGNYKFGITMDDLKYNKGMMEFRTFAIDHATSLNLEMGGRYFFVKEGSPYVYSKLDKEFVNEGEDIVNTMSFNNVSNANKLEVNLSHYDGLNIKEVKINEKAKQALSEQGLKATVTHKEIQDDFGIGLNIVTTITDNEGNKAEYSGDIDLVDVVINVEDDTLFSKYSFSTIPNNQKITNSKGEPQEIITRPIYDTSTIYQNSSEVYLTEPNEALGMRNHDEKFTEYTWVEDNKGKKYPVYYDSYNGIYISQDLPVSEEEYKIVTKAPGHFRREEKFVPSRIYDNKLVGKSSMSYGTIQSPAGDVDDNGVIDIFDAIELSKDYKKPSNESNISKDFNLDGQIDNKDMDYIVQNFMMINYQDKNAKDPQATANGKTLDDILKEIGYK